MLKLCIISCLWILRKKAHIWSCVFYSPVSFPWDCGWTQAETGEKHILYSFNWNSFCWQHFLFSKTSTLVHVLNNWTETSALQAYLFKKSPFGHLWLQNGHHKKIQSPKTKKTWRGGHFMTYYTLQKNVKGEDISWPITGRANAPNSRFSTLYFAAVSLHIHVEFLNDKRGNEKDRWCCCLSYWLNLSCYW